MSNSLFLKLYRRFIAPIDRRRIINSPTFKPHIITIMDGGLGSQMWQYAFGRGASLKSGLPILFDLTFFMQNCKDANSLNNRNFDIERTFGIDVPRANSDLISMYKKFFYHNNDSKSYFYYDQTIQSSSQARYLCGYYVNAQYIAWQGDALRDIFSFKLEMNDKNANTLKMIRSKKNTVAIHIRRGDYIGGGLDITTAKYFRTAIETMAKNIAGEPPTFFVFSNGMDWAKEILRDMEHRFVFVENNDNDSGANDMYLMSECEHFIISNSSFSWWPAWLSRRSPNKIVIMPDRWHKAEPSNCRQPMMVDGWIACEC